MQSVYLGGLRPPPPRMRSEDPQVTARRRRARQLVISNIINRKAEGTTKRKKTIYVNLADNHARNLLKEECERRKARREVLHANGHAGSKKRYPNRKKPGAKIKC